MIARMFRPAARAIAAAVLIVSSVAPLPSFSAVPPSVELPPIKFRSQYGDLKFPEKYPEGTAIEITLQSHFVPKYDEWFDSYAKEWGKAHDVMVTPIHMNLANLPKALSSALESKQGSTLFEMVSPPTLYVERLLPLNDVNEAAEKAFGQPAQTCARSTYVPSKKLWTGFCQAYVLNPMLYRISWWKDAGYPKGPQSFDDLLNGGTTIFQKNKEHRVGLGMAPEIDSEGWVNSLLWSFGGTLQDADGKPALDSPQTVKAVAYAKKLYKAAELPEVIDAKNWTAASNNEGLMADRLSFIENAISVYRTSLDSKPEIAADTGVNPALLGPNGKRYPSLVQWHTDVIPQYVTDKDQITAAKNFILDLQANYANANFHSKTYNMPNFSSVAPDVWREGGWLSKDPWAPNHPDKLDSLRSAEKTSTWLGYPGYLVPWVSEVWYTHILPAMLASAATGEKTPEQAVKDAAKQVNEIYEKWKAKGF